MNSNDNSQELQARIEAAIQSGQALHIHGGQSKTFYGRKIQAQPLDVTSHRGIINYEPTELVITARAGTPLSEIEKTLADNQQMLGFEPPSFAASATLGGTIACNLSGPRRAYRGAARDYVLGSTIINGKAEQLHFGGEVMKNVAGYDVSRLMCGAMGTLGLILDVSLKVIPRPEQEITLVHELNEQQALDSMHQWMQQAHPISATCFDGEKLYTRLASNQATLDAVSRILGGEALGEAEGFWQQLKEQRLAFFKQDRPLWRLSLASNARPLNLQGDCLYEWGGALRWLHSEESVDRIRHTLESMQGHATVFRHPQVDDSQVHESPFHELPPALSELHRKLKQAFDPHSIFNPGHMYASL